VAIAGVVHFWWLVKIDYTRPLVYSTIIGALLIARIVPRPGTRTPATGAPQGAESPRRARGA
jgi:DMSO/TMAO reductase YedYZ heme-binding membrane subunit